MTTAIAVRMCLKCGRPDETDHACDRVLVAEFYQKGEIVCARTSEKPFSSGPVFMVMRNGADADRDLPAPVNGWHFRWAQR